MPSSKIHPFSLSVLILVPLFLVVGASIIGFAINYRTQHDPRASLFISGSLPSHPPDTFYPGTVNGSPDANWKGKKFNIDHTTGINVFAAGTGTKEAYPFKTYAAKGIADNVDVLKIDYDIADNPFWLRHILDEVVEVAPGKFLGKIHLKLIGNISIATGYFELHEPGR